MTKTLTEFIGLADAHGIESFKRVEDTDNSFVSILGLRAAHNRQRHAVVYRAFLNETGEKRVLKNIEDGHFMKALKTMRFNADEIFVENGWEKSWGLIPNPDLDPWHG